MAQGGGAHPLWAFMEARKTRLSAIIGLESPESCKGIHYQKGGKANNAQEREKDRAAKEVLRGGCVHESKKKTSFLLNVPLQMSSGASSNAGRSLAQNQNQDKR